MKTPSYWLNAFLVLTITYSLEYKIENSVYASTHSHSKDDLRAPTPLELLENYWEHTSEVRNAKGPSLLNNSICQDKSQCIVEEQQPYPSSIPHSIIKLNSENSNEALPDSFKHFIPSFSSSNPSPSILPDTNDDPNVIKEEFPNVQISIDNDNFSNPELERDISQSSNRIISSSEAHPAVSSNSPITLQEKIDTAQTEHLRSLYLKQVFARYINWCYTNDYANFIYPYLPLKYVQSKSFLKKSICDHPFLRVIPHILRHTRKHLFSTYAYPLLLAFPLLTYLRELFSYTRSGHEALLLISLVRKTRDANFINQLKEKEKEEESMVTAISSELNHEIVAAMEQPDLYSNRKKIYGIEREERVYRGTITDSILLGCKAAVKVPYYLSQDTSYELYTLHESNGIESHTDEAQQREKLLNSESLKEYLKLCDKVIPEIRKAHKTDKNRSLYKKQYSNEEEEKLNGRRIVFPELPVSLTDLRAFTVIDNERDKYCKNGSDTRELFHCLKSLSQKLSLMLGVIASHLYLLSKSYTRDVKQIIDMLQAFPLIGIYFQHKDEGIRQGMKSENDGEMRIESNIDNENRDGHYITNADDERNLKGVVRDTLKGIVNLILYLNESVNEEMAKVVKSNDDKTVDSTIKEKDRISEMTTDEIYELVNTHVNAENLYKPIHGQKRNNQRPADMHNNEEKTSGQNLIKQGAQRTASSGIFISVNSNKLTPFFLNNLFQQMPIIDLTVCGYIKKDNGLMVHDESTSNHRALSSECILKVYDIVNKMYLWSLSTAFFLHKKLVLSKLRVSLRDYGLSRGDYSFPGKTGNTPWLSWSIAYEKNLIPVATDSSIWKTYFKPNPLTALRKNSNNSDPSRKTEGRMASSNNDQIDNLPLDGSFGLTASDSRIAGTERNSSFALEEGTSFEESFFHKEELEHNHQPAHGPQTGLSVNEELSYAEKEKEMEFDFEKFALNILLSTGTIRTVPATGIVSFSRMFREKLPQMISLLKHYVNIVSKSSYQGLMKYIDSVEKEQDGVRRIEKMQVTANDIIQRSIQSSNNKLNLLNRASQPNTTPLNTSGSQDTSLLSNSSADWDLNALQASFDSTNSERTLTRDHRSSLSQEQNSFSSVPKEIPSANQQNIPQQQRRTEHPNMSSYNHRTQQTGAAVPSEQRHPTPPTHSIINPNAQGMNDLQRLNIPSSSLQLLNGMNFAQLPVEYQSDLDKLLSSMRTEPLNNGRPPVPSAFPNQVQTNPQTQLRNQLFFRNNNQHPNTQTPHYERNDYSNPNPFRGQGSNYFTNTQSQSTMPGPRPNILQQYYQRINNMPQPYNQNSPFIPPNMLNNNFFNGANANLQFPRQNNMSVGPQSFNNLGFFPPTMQQSSVPNTFNISPQVGVNTSQQNSDPNSDFYRNIVQRSKDQAHQRFLAYKDFELKSQLANSSQRNHRDGDSQLRGRQEESQRRANERMPSLSSLESESNFSRSRRVNTDSGQELRRFNAQSEGDMKEEEEEQPNVKHEHAKLEDF